MEEEFAGKYPNLLAKKNELCDSLWKLMSNERFRLKNFALNICSVFGSTYIEKALVSYEVIEKAILETE